MNKKAFLTASICLLLGGIDHISANPPVEGTGFLPIDATTAQNYLASYKSTVEHQFAEYYSLDVPAINKMVTSGAVTVRMYNGFSSGSKVNIMVPVDANNNNMSGAVMYSMGSIGICPPNCDITRTGAGTTTINNAAAQAAVNDYNSTGTNDAYNAFTIYPAALAGLKSAGCNAIQICHGLIAATGARCMIYRGVTSSGVTKFLIEDASSMYSRMGL